MRAVGTLDERPVAAGSADAEASGIGRLTNTYSLSPSCTLLTTPAAVRAAAASVVLNCAGSVDA